MIPRIVSVAPLAHYRLRLGFDDGTAGVVDLSRELSFRGVFAPLRDPERFAEVRIDEEAGTIAWPTGADLDPVVLYARAHATTPDEVLSRPALAKRGAEPS